METKYLFGELEQSNAVYKVQESVDYFLFECNHNMGFLGGCFDIINKQFVIAVKVQNGNLYHIDYLFMDEKFNLVNARREKEGVQSDFIIAPDRSIWVSLASTAKDIDGEIVLPLDNRGRVIKRIVKRDIGYSAYFSWNSDFYGYEKPLFGEKKSDKLALYQFDRSDCYKGKKNIKLDFCSGGYPFISKSSNCFIYQTAYQDDQVLLTVAQIDKSGQVLDKWSSDAVEHIHMCHLISADDGYLFVCSTTSNTLDLIRFDKAGKITSRYSLLTIDKITEFYHLYPVVCGEDGKYLLRYTSGEGNGLVQIYQNEAERSLFLAGGQVLEQKEELFRFDSKCAFKTIASDKKAFIVVAPIAHQENKWLILKD